MMRDATRELAALTARALQDVQIATEVAFWAKLVSTRFMSVRESIGVGQAVRSLATADRGDPEYASQTQASREVARGLALANTLRAAQLAPADRLDVTEFRALLLWVLRDPACIPELQALVAERRRIQGGGHPATLRSIANLAGALIDPAMPGEARDLLGELDRTRTRELWAEDADSLRTTLAVELARGQRGRDITLARLGGTLQDILDLQRRVLGGSHVDSLATASLIAVRLNDAAGPRARLRAFRWDGQVIRSSQAGAVGRATDLVSMVVHGYLARRGWVMSRAFVSDNDSLSRLAETARAQWGEGHPMTADAMSASARALALALGVGKRKKVRTAIGTEGSVLELRMTLLGREHPSVSMSKTVLDLMHTLEFAFRRSTRSRKRMARAERLLGGQPAVALDYWRSWSWWDRLAMPYRLVRHRLAERKANR